jgi:uncharacterized repeat protein (TIGR03833 family)
MNSARHANRSGGGQISSRGRRRGGFNDRSEGLSRNQSVPSIQQVVAGAAVSIVLKIDQPTGRQVQGIVSERLTAGNHPRGIKVRLQDGRVGRVQRMATDEEAATGSEGLFGLGRNGEIGGPALATSGSGFSGRRYEDFRIDEPDEPSGQPLSLADYVVVKTKGKGRGKKANLSDQSHDIDDSTLDSPSQDIELGTTITSTCPVCGEFEGDETAVAHHVNTHFD